MKITFTLPIKLVPKDNQRGGWKRHFFKITKPQREMLKTWTGAAMRSNGFAMHLAEFANGRPNSLPAKVQITRIAPRPLDVRDNLQSSAKPVIDGIADAFGVKDNDERLTFLEVKQERGKPREYACRVEIETL